MQKKQKCKKGKNAQKNRKRMFNLKNHGKNDKNAKKEQKCLFNLENHAKKGQKYIFNFEIHTKKAKIKKKKPHFSDFFAFISPESQSRWIYTT